MHGFEFKTQPFDHQLSTLERCWSSDYYALFMEMGTGKSKVAIDNMAVLYEAGKIKSALIVAPKGVYDNWIRAEIPTHMPDRTNTQIVRWTPAKTAKFAEELNEIISEAFEGLKIFVMNVEALSTPRGFEAAESFLKSNPDNMFIIDESTTIKNRKAARTKSVVGLSKLSPYRRILTGSPITQSPMDLFSQCLFLDPGALGFKSYYAFQNRYAKMQRRNMGARSFNQITGYQRLDELTKKLDYFSTRILKEECLDLPPKTYIRRDVELTPEQARLYKQMKTMALAQLETGDLSTTANVLTQIMRLQQICCGFFQPDDGTIQSIKNNRLPELLDIVEEVSGKTIIWATYTHDINTITEELQKKYGPRAVAKYNGDTPQDERQGIVERFQDKNDPLRFFVGQPRTGGYGITLTAAGTVIYFSNSYDLEIRLQSEDRAHRIGQKNRVTYIDLVSPKTIDEKILGALRDKIDIAGEVLGEKARTWFD